MTGEIGEERAICLLMVLGIPTARARGVRNLAEYIMSHLIQS